MFQYVVRRLALFPVVVFVISVLTFFMVRLLPGNPATYILGQFATHQEVAVLQRQLGLSLPIWDQYGQYAWRLVHGNFGVSFLTQQPVAQSMLPRIPVTAALAGLSMLVALIIGTVLAVLNAATTSKVWDLVLQLFTMVTLSVPSFILGLLAILLVAMQVQWFPVSGWSGPKSLILPALSLGLFLSGGLARILRASLFEALGTDYVRTARAKGVAHWGLIIRHALRNAALPTVTVAGLILGDLLGGAVVTETVFNLPGVGSYMVNAVLRRDFPEVQATVLVISTAFVVTNLVVDLVYAALDPRIRYE